MELLGISLTNVGLQEALIKTREYLEQGGLNTVAYVSARKLVEACENEEHQKWWNDLDLTICEDVEVLKAAGIDCENRQREVEENAYLREFLEILDQRRERVFLIASHEDQLQEFEEELQQFQKGNQGVADQESAPQDAGWQIVGRDSTYNYGENPEGLINRINVLAPKVILSRLPYPEGIRLMYEYHSYLNGSIWLTLPEVLMKDSRSDWTGKVSDFFYKKLFDKKIQQFEQEKE